MRTPPTAKRKVVLRISTKHINLRIHHLEVERREILVLARLMKLDVVKNEDEKEKSLECWARRCTNHFTKKARRMLFSEIDNMMMSGNVKDNCAWCKKTRCMMK